MMGRKHNASAFALIIVLLATVNVHAFDYSAEAEKFDKRIDDLAFVIGGLNASAVDGGVEQTGIEAYVESLNSLKQVYREMLSAMQRGDLNKAKEKRDFIFNELKRITTANGLNYNARDIERIIGPWSAYEIMRLQRIEEKKKEKPVRTPTPEPTPSETPSPVQMPVSPGAVQKTPKPQARAEYESNYMLALVLMLGLASMLAGIFMHVRRKRRLMYCILVVALVVSFPARVADKCVGNQCVEIVAGKIWSLEDVTLENGDVLPAGTLLCDANIERDGFWNDKCNAYCSDSECTGQGIKSSFDFKVTLWVKNTGPDHGYNTVLDGDRLFGLVYGGYEQGVLTPPGCLYESVRLLPGEVKSYSNSYR
ncbi:MAG: hypothetical protein J7L44_00565, partial [Candidatus Diapherotrites archaeon]|nr:hypothetical protein [Candidatus Diapherotrites archaeon]